MKGSFEDNVPYPLSFKMHPVIPNDWFKKKQKLAWPITDHSVQGDELWAQLKIQSQSGYRVFRKFEYDSQTSWNGWRANKFELMFHKK